MKEEERKRLADFVDARADKRKVFYYDGFYGSLITDVEFNRLVGKIEGIDKDIIYEYLDEEWIEVHLAHQVYVKPFAFKNLNKECITYPE